MTADAADDVLLVETIARHFPDAVTRDREIELGFGELYLDCHVHSIRKLGAYHVASLFFSLRGGRVGAPVFASASGYAESPHDAVAVGACHWACSFGPVLRAGLADEALPEVSRFELEVDGQRCRVFVDALDRALSLDGRDPDPRMAAARARFATEGWLARSVLESARLPMLAVDRPTMLGIFVSDHADKRVVEVKLDGVEWPGMAAVFAAAAPEPAGAMTMLRELAVIVPIGSPPPLARAPIERTLRGLAARDPEPWRGWAHHGATLAAPLAGETLAPVEATIGALPADYRAFLATVAACGAGPGYGLLSPVGEAQARLARGTFAWDDGAAPTTPVAGVLALAHAGCGVMWLLVVAGPHRGEVWVDARSSDGKARRVAASFSDWYRAWLAAELRATVPWIQWDSACCATAHILSQLSESEKPRALALAAAGGDYFAATTALDPCHGCGALAARFELAPDIFRAGAELELAHPTFAAPAPRGFWARLLGRT